MSGGRVLLTIDFDIPTEQGPQVKAMEYLLKEILPAASRPGLKLVILCTGPALEQFRERNIAFDEFKSLMDLGMIEVGNHTYSHPDITGAFMRTEPLTCAEQETEILSQNKLMKEIFGTKPVVFRGPFFNYNDDTHEILAGNGMKFNLSGYITRDEFRPTGIIRESSSAGDVFRIPVNLKLSTKEWKEPIMVYAPGLVREGLHNIVFHPYEITHYYSHCKGTLDNLLDLMRQDVTFVHCGDFLSELYLRKG